LGVKLACIVGHAAEPGSLADQHANALPESNGNRVTRASRSPIGAHLAVPDEDLPLWITTPAFSSHSSLAIISREKDRGARRDLPRAPPGMGDARGSSTHDNLFVLLPSDHSIRLQQEYHLRLMQFT
jgi:hypothetical protein